MSNQNNIPHLRFKGFEADWQIRKLGELTEKIGDGLHGTPIYSDDSDIYFINGNNLTNGKIEITEKTKKVDYAIFKKNDKGLNENTILISLNGTIGNIAKYNNEKVMLGKSVGYYKFKEKTDFYYHIFHTDKIQNFFISELTGSTIKNLSLKTLRETIISFPTLPEQQKIVSFLSAVDEKIQQLSRKKELLEQYKKGVMQQLFSGKLRFKDENGEDYADWEDKILDDVIHFVNGKGHEQSIDENGDFVVVNSKFVSTEGRVRKFCNSQISPLSKGDIVMVMSDVPNGKALAKCYLIEKDNLYTLNQRICGLKAKEDNLNDFLIYLLNRNKYYLSFDSGVGQTNLKKDEVLNCPLFIPTSIPEQQKIADFLSSIDIKIESTNQQIKQTQSFKKGLLQQLFV